MAIKTYRTHCRLLVVDDDRDMRDSLVDLLADAGYTVEASQTGGEALEVVQKSRPDLLLTDLVMNGMQGLELLRAAKQRDPALAVVVITAFGTIESAVEAMRRGAFYYLTKPFKSADLLLLVERALEERQLRTEVQRLRKEVETHYQFEHLIGKSPAMQHVFDLIERLKDSSIDILLTGESGTGKDLVARTLHYHSPRKQGPFVPVNCAALPEHLLESELFGYIRGAFTDARHDKKGLFMEAHGGTLFLDEIAEIPLMLQAKLLRDIDTKEIRPLGATKGEKVDVRIMAATNSDLRRAVAEGKFREDLFYRLNVIEIRLPSLRERPEDIPLLLKHFMEHSTHPSQAARLSSEALSVLLAYPWPGNVRELKNAIERARILCRGPEITEADLPSPLTLSTPHVINLQAAFMGRRSLTDIEREYILVGMRLAEGNKREVAEVLGVDRKTLYRKLEEYGWKGDRS
jgi:DNA-binding NtrC family response regulator